MNFLTALKHLQRSERLTDKKMADILGIEREYWNSVKNGKANLSDTVKRKAVAAYPDQLTDIFLSEILTKS